MSAEKIDIFTRHKDEYKAGKTPALVATSRGLYLSIKGQGAPGEDEYTTAITALYGMAYTIKMGRKADGKGDHTIGKLEATYWTADEAPLDPAQMDTWRWQLLIRTPESVAGLPSLSN